MKSVKRGGPQGSLPVPISFLIYMNDLHNTIYFHSVLYAGDTTIAAKGKNSIEMEAVIKDFFQIAKNWLSVNELSLSEDKTMKIGYQIQCCSTCVFSYPDRLNANVETAHWNIAYETFKYYLCDSEGMY